MSCHKNTLEYFIIMKQRFFLTLFLLAFTVTTQAQSEIDSLKSVLTGQTNKQEQLTTLDQLTKKMIRSNHLEQKKYISKYMTLAKELKEYDKMAIKSRCKPLA